MVLILFVQVLKKVLKSLTFELKNPAATLEMVRIWNGQQHCVRCSSANTPAVSLMSRQI